MKLSAAILTAVSMASFCSAHGYFQKPKGRQPGKKYQDVCGMQIYYNMDSDINGNIQGLEQVSVGQTDYNPAECHLWKCKGMRYADNKDNVQHYKPGQSVSMYFQIVAPHSGSANVSIVDTHKNEVIHPNLKKWNEYALTSIPIKESWEKFDVKMPTTLGSHCATPGKCVIQMFWNAPSINQTYESCVDFTMSGSGKRDLEDFEAEERLHPRDFHRL